jgi:dTDP-glucose pyrophosphorylase
MKTIDKIILRPDATIREALEIIDYGSMHIALVTDNDRKLLGTISDGDIRRALLKGKRIEDKISDTYNPNPIAFTINEPRETMIRIASSHRIFQIPVVDENGKLIGIEEITEYLKVQPYDNPVIIMAGGTGSRLQQLTKDIPKPLLMLGDKSLLDTIIQNFSMYGFNHFILSVNYKSEMIKDHFKNGDQLGVQIDYIQEKEKMGTAGSLSLLKTKPLKPFFVMNGDILTNINLEQLLNYHLLNKADATIAVREINYEIPYGVIHHEDKKIVQIKEKPAQNLFINAGIYLLNPSCLDHLPSDKYIDMPDFLNSLIQSGMNIISFPLREYWLDIGKMDDFNKARTDYQSLFNSYNRF